MKKVLLTLMAFVATMTVSAEWTASFEPVSEAAELKGIHTTTAADGSVYVSSSYNQGFSFAGKDVTDPEGLTSACIVKYSATGEELWAVTMEGAATVYALDTDADGTLYVAGNFTDMVKYIGTDGVAAEITCETVISAFVAKISTDGKFEVVKVITPAVNETIASAVGDPWGMGIEEPLYSMWDPIYVTPNKIQVEGDKVYVSAKYMGDVTELNWKGSYIDMWGMMYSDNYSMGVFSLNKADLTGATNVANVQMTGVISDTQYYPEAISFVAENGTVYVSFIGFQKLTLTTADKTEDFTFAVSEDGENMEHALVLATIGETTTTETFNVAPHSSLYTPYNLFMNVADENLIISGTYYGEFPFDTEVTTGENKSDIFVASVKKAGNEVNWAYTSETESEAISVTINENVFIASTVGNFNIDLTTGEATPATITETISCTDGATFISINEGKVCINNIAYENSSVESAIINSEKGISYNLAGQTVENNFKGIVIVNGKKCLVK